jgi:glutamate---cysteine ligase / carboxylate-amine ligase
VRIGSARSSRHHAGSSIRFGRNLTLGVEEELVLVDVASLEPVSAVQTLVPEPDERLKYELFQCLVETATPICGDAYEALAALQRLREEVAVRAEAAGVTYLSAGMHPTAHGADQEVVDLPRYRKMADEMGDELQRQLVCGLHVHVGMPSQEACLAAYESVVQWLPALLSLSASSPHAEGEETGQRSSRASRIEELPGASIPPLLTTWEEWEEVTSGRDYTRIWWDARPHPRLGTLEVRMPDAQPDVRRSAGFAALIQALAAAGVERPAEPLDREEYVRRRELAARSPAPVDALAEASERAAKSLGSWPLVEELLAGLGEAERLLAIGRRDGMHAVLRDLVERSGP